MTIKELSQLYWLKKEIKYDEERLATLQAEAMAPSSVNLDGMPHDNKNATMSKVEKITLDIIDLQAIISTKRIQCIYERQRLERYIATVPDSLTRLIMTLRFVDGQSWSDVAVNIGGGNSKDAIKKRVYRYLESIEEPEITAPASPEAPELQQEK